MVDCTDRAHWTISKSCLIAETIFVYPLNTACCERGFAVMKKIKNDKSRDRCSCWHNNCDVSKVNAMAHNYFATASNVREMYAKYPKETMLLSCDSNVKIHIGGQAVSRYHQVRTFFPVDDMPHYGDHDFHIPNYLIKPDGYLLLQSKSQITVTIKDKLGRNVVDVRTTGPMWIYNNCANQRIMHHTETTLWNLWKGCSLYSPNHLCCYVGMAMWESCSQCEVSHVYNHSIRGEQKQLPWQ